MDAETRISCLERSLIATRRMLFTAVLAIVAVAICGFSRGPGTVEATKFILIDDESKPRMMIGTDASRTYVHLLPPDDPLTNGKRDPTKSLVIISAEAGGSATVSVNGNNEHYAMLNSTQETGAHVATKNGLKMWAGGAEK